MEAFDARGLCVIAEELSEEDEADDEEAFVMVQDSHTPDAFCSHCHVLTHTGAAVHARHTHLALGPAAQQIKEELSRSRGKLSQKIVEMENFASNLEEIFITVEVRDPSAMFRTHTYIPLTHVPHTHIQVVLCCTSSQVAFISIALFTTQSVPEQLY
ncbi:unnamed protein product [Leuciscus chuanchicus]